MAFRFYRSRFRRKKRNWRRRRTGIFARIRRRKRIARMRRRRRLRLRRIGYRM